MFITSFVNELLVSGGLGQSKPLYILSHDFYFGLSTHTKWIMLWLNEVKKTCQARFLEVEAKEEKTPGYFAHQFVIFEGLT